MMVAAGVHSFCGAGGLLVGRKILSAARWMLTMSRSAITAGAVLTVTGDLSASGVFSRCHIL